MKKQLLYLLFIIFHSYNTAAQIQTAIEARISQAELGDDLEAMDVGDINNDGYPDILVSTDYKVFWYDNTSGNGTFNTVHTVDEGFEVNQFAVKLADVDADGDLDIIKTDVHSIYLIRNIDGQGTFAEPELIADAYSHRNIATGDLDGDGDTDIVCTSYHGDRIVWYENTDGMGGFAPAVILVEELDQVHGITLADFDNDGSLDFVTGWGGSSANTHEVAWYRNNNNGASFTKHYISNLYRALSFVAVDFDEDGDLDLLTASGWNGITPTNNAVRIYWNENGAFTGESSVDYMYRQIILVRAADIDNDGDQDVITAFREDCDFGIMAYENIPSGWSDGFEVSEDAKDPVAIALADFNNDGKLDIASASEDDGKVAWYEGNGNGTFDSETVLTQSEIVTPICITTANMDGDENMDVVVGTSRGGLVWYERDLVTGEFSNPRTIKDFDCSIDKVVAADIDNDGDDDLMVLGDPGFFAMKNLGSGLSFGIPFVLGGSQDFVMRDLNDDGYLDILIDHPGDYIGWYINQNGDGTFITDSDNNISEFLPHDIDAADVDGDGDTDIIYAFGVSDSHITWVRQNDNNYFYNYSDFSSDSSVLPLADVDNDGLIDIYTTKYNSFKRYTYNPDTDYMQLLQSGIPGLFHGVFKDVDGDSDLDLVKVRSYTTSSDGGIQYSENLTGIGDFTAQPTALLTAYNDSIFCPTSAYSLADADNDGDLDFFVIGGTCSEQIGLRRRVSYFENTTPLPLLFASVDMAFEGCDNALATLSVDVMNGTPPYQYSIDNLNFGDNNIFTVNAGDTLIVSAQDAAGTIVSSNEIIVSVDVENLPVYLNVYPAPNTIDFNVSVEEANITVFAQGGVGTLMYSIDGENYQEGNQFSSLDNGTYTIYVQDEEGCVVTTEAVVAVNYLQLSFEQTAITCFEAGDGSLEVLASGGVLPYSYRLNEGEFQSEPVFSGLTAGEYEVFVLDADGFERSLPGIVFNEPEPLVIGADFSENQIVIVAVGGTGALMYSIDGQNYQSTAVFSDLPEGDYTIYVRDENDCTESQEVSLVANSISIFADFVSPSCSNSTDGGMIVYANGGTSPFTYSLDGENFQDSNLFPGLTAGTYLITVGDANNYFHSVTVELTGPEPLTLDLSVEGNSITAVGGGGTGSYSYSLNNQNYQSSGLFSDLANGTYTVSVQDENACVFSESVSIDYSPLAVNFSVDSPVLCYRDSTGVVTVTASGGTAPYQYSINNGLTFQSSGVFTDLPTGNYIIIVNDSEGLSLSNASLSLDSPPAIEVTLEANENNLTVFAEGGVPPYSYGLSGFPFQEEGIFNDLPNGEYTVYVRDANECTEVLTWSINMTGLEPLPKELFMIYPNPASGSFIFDKGANSPELIVFELYNSQGGRVLTQVCRERETRVEVSQLPSSLYFYRVYSRGVIRGQGKLVLDD